ASRSVIARTWCTCITNVVIGSRRSRRRTARSGMRRRGRGGHGRSSGSIRAGMPLPVDAPDHRQRVTVLNSVSLNTGDAAILAGLRAALLDAFGPELDLHVADDAPDAARARYPEIEFSHGLHGSGLEAKHVLRGAARSMHRRRVRL